MKEELLNSKMTINRTDFFIGFLLGLPFAMPIPFYWFSFLAFVLALTRMGDSSLLRRQLIIFIALFSLGIFSSIVSKYHFKVEAFRMLYSSLSFLFFLFGAGVRDFRSLFRGYLTGAVLLSVYTVILFVLLKPYEEGAYMFIYVDYRNWAIDFIPDWPNLYSFNVCVAGLVALFIFNSKKLSLYFLFVALITTSRISLVYFSFLLIFIVFKLLKERRIIMATFLFLIVGFIIIKLGTLSSFEGSNQLADRLNKTADRELVYTMLIQEFEENPIIGIGNITVEDFLGLDANVSSFHNTFLEVSVRYGVIGLLFFLVMISPASLKGDKTMLMIMVFFVVCAMFQNILRHPHNVMLYSAILYFHTYGKRHAKTN